MKGANIHMATGHFKGLKMTWSSSSISGGKEDSVPCNIHSKHLIVMLAISGMLGRAEPMDTYITGPATR